MKTVGTKVRVLMLVLAFVLIANLAPAHAIDRSMDDVRVATLMENATIEVNTVTMPYRPYRIGNEVFVPVDLAKIMFNAETPYDAIKREFVLYPKVERFVPRHDRVDSQYLDNVLPEYALAYFPCGVTTYVQPNEDPANNIPFLAANKSLALINGKAYLPIRSLVDMANIGDNRSSMTYVRNNAVVDINNVENADALVVKVETDYLPIPVQDKDEVVSIYTYLKYLHTKMHPEKLMLGTWNAQDLLIIDGQNYDTSVVMVIEEEELNPNLYQITKTHTILSGSYQGQVIKVRFNDVDFLDCGNRMVFDRNMYGFELLQAPAEFAGVGMESVLYYYNNLLHGYYNRTVKPEIHYTR